MKSKTLPGFKEIEFGDAGRLFIDSHELIQEGSIIDVYYGYFTTLPVAGLAGCKVTSDIVSGETIYTTALNFNIKDCGPSTRRLMHDLVTGDCTFRLTDVYNQKYLLGLNNKPHPSVKPSFQSEYNPSGQRVFSVEVQYVNTHSILQLK